jgi:signal peptidase II
MSKANETGAPLPEAGAASQAGSQRSGAETRPRRPRSPGRSRAASKGFSTAAILGFSAALITLVLDQATKLYTLFVFDLPVKEPVEFAPFINLIVVWNRGISYGLFQQHSDIGRWILIVISILAAVGLSVWIRRTAAKLLALSLGLIVGGAIGNVIDRLAYGAVFDFIQFQIGSWSWYVFNVADAAIVAGVVGLLYDSFVLEGRRAKK